MPQQSSGTADFSNYIAVGNSLTAGYSDFGLYDDVQMQSYPNLIGQQMKEITDINFKQPDIPGNGSGYFYVADLDLSTTPPTPSIGIFNADPNWLDQLEGPFNNLGVPGIRVKDITENGYGDSPQANPYFYRMLGGKEANMSYLDLVQESKPSFFTSWLGNNDVLGYALDGGAMGIGELTDPETEFKPSYDALISALTSQGGKGVVATIPDIILAPFFTAMPWNGLELDATIAVAATQFYAFAIDTTVLKMVEVEVIMESATQLVYQGTYDEAIAGGATEEQAEAIAEAFLESTDGQAAVASANDLISVDYYQKKPDHPFYPITEQKKSNIIALLNNAGLIPTFSEGPNPFVIEVPVTASNPIGIRQMKEGELVLLTALLNGFLTGQAALFPMPDRYILTSDEMKNINDYTDDFNDIIRGYASSTDIAIFETNEILAKVKEGIWTDGVNVNGDFLTGGAFSLDGIHLTPRGYSIVANGFIELINSNFDANLSPVIINNYRAVILP